MNAFSSSTFLAWLIGGFLLMPLPAFAHDLQYTVVGGQAVVIKLFYADNTPFTFEGYEIFRDGEKLPYQVGRTDSQGRIAFLPDQAANWRVKAISEDGHGLDFKLSTDSAAAKALTVNRFSVGGQSIRTKS